MRRNNMNRLSMILWFGAVIAVGFAILKLEGGGVSPKPGPARAMAESVDGRIPPSEQEATIGGPETAALPAVQPAAANHPAAEVPAPVAVAASHVERPTVSTSEPVGEVIPLAPMGSGESHSAFAGKPGYKPLNDPEADSERIGRREAPKVDRPFTGGASSADELAQQILDAMAARDKKALLALRVTRDEFDEILWPEFPASRPATKLKAADAWFFLDADCVKGVNAAVDESGGRNLLFDKVTYDIGRAPYRNFALYQGVRIQAHTSNGERVTIGCAQTFAERNGTWKIYSLKD